MRQLVWKQGNHAIPPGSPGFDPRHCKLSGVCCEGGCARPCPGWRFTRLSPIIQHPAGLWRRPKSLACKPLTNSGSISGTARHHVYRQPVPSPASFRKKKKKDMTFQSLPFKMVSNIEKRRENSYILGSLFYSKTFAICYTDMR